MADRALEIAERLGRPGTTSAARDARTVLLHALNRYDEALENDDARFALLPKIRWREEQMDVCAATARTRQAIGDFAGSVEAVRKAEQLAAARRPALALAARPAAWSRPTSCGTAGTTRSSPTTGSWTCSAGPRPPAARR